MLKKPAKINVVVLAIVLTCIVFSQTGQGYIANELSLDQQSSLRGGGCEQDCRVTGNGCFFSPSCTSDANCNEGEYICSDFTPDEHCITTGGAVVCITDTTHTCEFKTTLTGYCDHGVICIWNFHNLGECDLGGFPIFAHRCHRL